MRALGIDLGERRIGVAVSDSGGTLATPVDTVKRTRDAHQHRRQIAELAADLGAEVIVVGHPRSLDGGSGPAARAAEDVADAHARVTGLPVVLHDERLTTTEAERALGAAGVRGRRRRQVVDRTAAMLILQSWLDSRR
jgi:putative Holliday junction resolvase